MNGSKKLLADDTGVNAILEYLITFISAFIIFTLMLTMFNNMFIDGPRKSVSAMQFTDIGNDVTAKILDTYLIAPETGAVLTKFEMPTTVAGEYYDLAIKNSDNGWDKEIEVSSVQTGINRSITINGISSTIPISGYTSSSLEIHTVEYISKND